MTTQSTILIVDDDPLGRDTLEALLINEGYHLAFAANGAQALAQIEEIRPDLVLLDVMMPDMDGFQVCRRVRATPDLVEIPIIMVTALDDRESRLRGIEAGADDFVTKPFDRLELRTRVRTITRLDRYRRLLAERARLEWIVDQAEDGYLWINGQDEILYANPQARLYLGMPAAESPAAETVPPVRTFLELARMQYRCEPEANWSSWPNVQTDEQDLYLIRPETPTAVAFWLRVAVQNAPFGADDNRILRLQNVSAEISGRFDMRGFHEALRHKIRTPFTGILGSLELLAQRRARSSAEETALLAQMALESAQRLRDTLSDILGYLNLHSASRIGEFFGLDELAATVREVAANLKIASVDVDCPPDLHHLRLLLTRQAVELILWELLENAVKFHPTQTPVVQIRAFQVDAERIGLQVIDDGTHISPEHLSHLGQPYYQGEKYFTGESKGTGLGLSTVIGLTWNAGGTCHIQNRLDGNGIRVDLVIPAHQDSE